MPNPEDLARAEVEFRKQLAGCVAKATKELGLPDDSVRTALIITLVDIDMRIKYNLPLEGDIPATKATPD